MSYIEELRGNYRAVRSRLTSLAPNNKFPRISGEATGRMWLGIDPAAGWFLDRRKATDIIDAVLQVTGVSRAGFFGHRRPREQSEARQLAYFFLKHHTQLSMPQIGRMIGGRDHSTVVHGVHRVATDPDIFGGRVLAIAKALHLRPPACG
jgi:hypothetical protein